MRNTKVRAIADTAVSSALCALLIIISIFVPPLSLFAAVASGIPLMYVSCKWGSAFGFGAVFCAAGVVFILSGDLISTLLIMSIYGCSSVAFGVAVNRKLKFSSSVFITAVFVLIGLVGQVMLINGDNDGIRSIINQVVAETQKSMEMILDQAGMANNAEIMTELSTALSQVTETVITYMPSFLIISAVVYAYGICMIGIFFMKRLRVRDISYIRFSMIHSPKMLCFGLAIIFILNLSEGDGVFESVLKNISIISMAALAVSGLSYIDFKFSKAIRSGYVRALIYVIIGFSGFMFMSFVFVLLTAIGSADAVFNFRRFRRIGR